MSEEQTPVETPVETTDTVEQPGMLNDEGNFNADWLQGLPDDLGNHSIWNKYNNPIDLAKGAINAQSMVGGKLEDLLASEDQNDIHKVHELLGVPTTVDGYALNIEAPEGIEIDDSRVQEFKELAFEHGISNNAVQALIDFDMKALADSVAQEDVDYDVSVNDAEAELREIWKGDQFDYNMSKVAEVMEFMGLEELMDDPSIGNNVQLIQALYNNVLPLIDNDDLIQQRNNDNFASLSDQLSEIEQKMMQYTGNTSDITYQNWIKERSSLLEKIS
tara:strand:+ start:4888 stop:5712 length:825 start_codon:yes stop_codon:yes gene_type:complete